VFSSRAATGPFAKAAEAELYSRTRNVIAELFHAHAVAMHHQMHDRIGEKIDEGRFATRLKPLPRDMRKIRIPLLTHNRTPEE
jgi:hypothetical protein